VRINSVVAKNKAGKETVNFLDASWANMIYDCGSYRIYLILSHGL